MNKTEESRQGFNRWAKKYDHFFLAPFLQRLQRDTVAAMQKKEKVNVLDIACGTGYALSLLPKAKCYGIDIASEMIRVAKEKHQSISFREGDARKLPFKNTFFDYVLCTEALHHLEEPNKVIAEIRRVLKREGHIIITDITFPQPIRFFVELFDPGCVTIRTMKEAELLFQQNKLRIIKKEKKKWYAYTFVLQKTTALS